MDPREPFKKGIIWMLYNNAQDGYGRKLAGPHDKQIAVRKVFPGNSKNQGEETKADRSLPASSRTISTKANIVGAHAGIQQKGKKKVLLYRRTTR